MENAGLEPAVTPHAPLTCIYPLLGLPAQSAHRTSAGSACSHQPQLTSTPAPYFSGTCEETWGCGCSHSQTPWPLSHAVGLALLKQGHRYRRITTDGWFRNPRLQSTGSPLLAHFISGTEVKHAFCNTRQGSLSTAWIIVFRDVFHNGRKIETQSLLI